MLSWTWKRLFLVSLLSYGQHQVELVRVVNEISRFNGAVTKPIWAEKRYDSNRNDSSYLCGSKRNVKTWLLTAKQTWSLSRTPEKKKTTTSVLAFPGHRQVTLNSYFPLLCFIHPSQFQSTRNSSLQSLVSVPLHSHTYTSFSAFTFKFILFLFFSFLPSFLSFFFFFWGRKSYLRKCFQERINLRSAYIRNLVIYTLVTLLCSKDVTIYLLQDKIKFKRGESKKKWDGMGTATVRR